MKQKVGAMHVAKIKRRHGDRVYVSHLVRRSVREGRRVRHETIANVSKLPPAAIEALSAALRGEAVLGAESLRITAALPAGHAEAVLLAVAAPRPGAPARPLPLKAARAGAGDDLPAGSLPRLKARHGAGPSAVNAR